jgi:tetratricopeptide (TPR) repeat protein
MNLLDCLRKKRTGKEQAEVLEGVFKLRLQSYKSQLAMAELVFSEELNVHDLYTVICSKLPDLTPDRMAPEDMQSILQWLCTRYPNRWEGQELLAQLLYKQGKRDSLEVAVKDLEGQLRKLGIYDEKKDLLNKYKEIEEVSEVKDEVLDHSLQTRRTVPDDQVKIKLETNIYNILKKKAEEATTGGEEKLNEDNKGKGSEALGFTDLFQNFKQDLQAKIPEGDYQTHFNLGIAYREMSLHDDALREFEIALNDPSLRYDCYFFMGQSLMEQDKPDEAIAAYTNGMALEGLSHDKLLGLKYEVALALLETGRDDDALRYLREICQSQSDYRDVVERIKALSG